jgi:hypothetical protein
VKEATKRKPLDMKKQSPSDSRTGIAFYVPKGVFIHLFTQRTWTLHAQPVILEREGMAPVPDRLIRSISMTPVKKAT